MAAHLGHSSDRVQSIRRHRLAVIAHAVCKINLGFVSFKGINSNQSPSIELIASQLAQLNMTAVMGG